MPEIELIHEAKDILGEGPIWHPEEQALYWCDNLKSDVKRYDPKTGAVEVYPMPEEVGSIIFREDAPGVVAGTKSGFGFIDLAAGRIDTVARPEAHRTDTRLNDGKCDRRGRFWCGSMHVDLSQPVASLYRFDPDGSCHRKDDGIIVTNGIAFSPDDKVLYYADSRAEAVYAFDFDLESGEIANKRLFISTADIPGRVDGATVDQDGNYWCAIIHDWRIAQYDPTGRLMRSIRMPVQRPTMCTFGGPDLDTLYVTSCTRFSDEQELKDQPLAGALFAVHDVGARGLPEPKFAG
jgi:sugar lactone lactonase YvrE